MLNDLHQVSWSAERVQGFTSRRPVLNWQRRPRCHDPSITNAAYGVDGACPLYGLALVSRLRFLLGGLPLNARLFGHGVLLLEVCHDDGRGAVANRGMWKSQRWNGHNIREEAGAAGSLSTTILLLVCLTDPLHAKHQKHGESDSNHVGPSITAFLSHNEIPWYPRAPSNGL